MEGVTGYAIDGSFAEYLWIPFITGESAIKLPETLDYRNLSLIEPLGLAVGLARKAKAGDSVLVLGQELIGLGVVAKLKERGIGTVIACDVSDKRLKASKNVGADIIVNSLEEDVTKVVMKETSGKGADVVIVLDPRPLALLQALSATRRAGMIWLATNYTSPFKFSSPLVSTEIYIGPIASYIEPPVTFNPCLVSCQTAWGTLRERQPRWLEAIKLIQSGKITAEKHVTHVFPLEKIEEAFNAALTNEAIKVLVEP
jgi:threonine dehydrogenase-like Zn-dependent dehydrogenase